MAVENVYFESTDGLLAEKTTTQDCLPDVSFGSVPILFMRSFEATTMNEGLARHKSVPLYPYEQLKEKVIPVYETCFYFG